MCARRVQLPTRPSPSVGALLACPTRVLLAHPRAASEGPTTVSRPIPTAPPHSTTRHIAVADPAIHGWNDARSPHRAPSFINRKAR